MEVAFTSFLLKSTLWLSAFGLMYFITLRNERYFKINRVFLITGLIASLLFPLFTIRYNVNIRLPEVPVNIGEMQVTQLAEHPGPDMTWKGIVSLIIIAGSIVYLFRLINQLYEIHKIIRNSPKQKEGRFTIITTSKYRHSFSFFSYIIIHPDVTAIEKQEIIRHESEHINQRHWADLLLAEIVGLLQWFNPLARLYIHLIRQNHEYLADREALIKTPRPAIYKAVLINQISGGEVLRLTHSFNYSLNNKRFTMMKNRSTSGLRQLKPILVIPAIALLFYAFSEPTYSYIPSTNTSEKMDQPSSAPSDLQADITDTTIRQKETPKSVKTSTTETIKKIKVTGVVTSDQGAPLEDAIIRIKNTNRGIPADKKGQFQIEEVPEDAQLVVSKVGYITGYTAPAKELQITLHKNTVALNEIAVVAYAPSSETSPTINKQTTTPPQVTIKGTSKDHPPLVILDGQEITLKEMSKISPDAIQSIDVIKDTVVIKEKYGKVNNSGVIIITTKKEEPENDTVFKIVEEMPEYPGGQEALREFVASNIKYPAEAQKGKIEGKVYVTFIISAKGKVENTEVIRGVHETLDKEALRVVNAMPDWKPGMQRGKPVAVEYTIPINFALQ
ncbi:TonB family protein [Geofilum sp. OHC36d9]|uniref:TonB family protein n=1 Tax=Geofilum sp. OHC36d9 TaxID=3458413 RepID=UPI0040344AB7